MRNAACVVAYGGVRRAARRVRREARRVRREARRVRRAVWGMVYRRGHQPEVGFDQGQGLDQG